MTNNTKVGQFTILRSEGQARAGELLTRHGPVQTPAFVPCATHGSLRGVPLSTFVQSVTASSTHGESSHPAGDPGLQLILANAYHLYLRPGIDTIEALGGLHQFMGWDRPIISDSGGFQAFALPKYVRYHADGIEFRSHIDGSLHQFSPEKVIEIQQQLGVDIATCLDVCTGFPAGETEVARAVSQTTEWARRSVERWSDHDMLLYGMVQGSIYPNLRRRAVEELVPLPFSGFAIGGNMYTFGQPMLQLAKEKPRMWEVVALTCSLLPTDKPRHLLGVGEPTDLIEGVRAGVDTFDCVMATRIARHGAAWIRRSAQTWEFDRVDLTAAAYATDDSPLDGLCTCPTCNGGYQRGYLRHLLKIHDPLALTLLSIHNVAQLNQLTGAMRSALLDGSFETTFPQTN